MDKKIAPDTQIIHDKQDLTYLSWSKMRQSSGTAGSLLKAYSLLSGKKIYYKLSSYDSLLGIVGHESANEIIADRLLTLLDIEHLRYQLIHADVLVNGVVQETYVCASENFRQPEEDKLALDVFFGQNHFDGETPLEFCIRMGWSHYIWNMFVVDYLLLNRDRHGANLEVLRNKKQHSLRLAPLFDHGLSLLCSCRTEKEAAAFDVMADRPVQSFPGSRSAKENLRLIPRNSLPVYTPLTYSDRSFLLDGLDKILSQNMQDKIWEMIWKRWCYYEDFCHSG